MRLTRPIFAASLLAAVTLLASCSSNNDVVTTTPAVTEPTAAVGPLDFTMTPAILNFGYTGGPTMPAKQSVRIGGNIAIATYAFLGPTVYSTVGLQPWLIRPTAPTFGGGWNFEFRTNPVGLPDGVYTARIAVTVPGARNNPQSLLVTLTVCTGGGNCLFNGSTTAGEFTNADPKWNRSSVFNNSGTYPYDDYRLFIAPFTTLWVHVLGSCSGVGTLFDPYQYAFTPDVGHTFINADDDGFGCVFDSKMPVTNSTGAPIEVFLRETVFSDTYRGTYVIYVRDHQLFPGGGFALRAVDEETAALIEAKKVLKEHDQN